MQRRYDLDGEAPAFQRLMFHATKDAGERGVRTATD
jgi:hypothetical protein